jgi:hypothetical protein
MDTIRKHYEELKKDDFENPQADSVSLYSCTPQELNKAELTTDPTIKRPWPFFP